MAGIANLVTGLCATALLFAFFAWLVILPTVGLLYSFGVLP